MEMIKQSAKELIRDIPDFPKPGIVFKDITPLLANHEVYQSAIDSIAAYFQNKGVEQVVCLEARGFIVGAPLAYKMGAGITLVRKPDKLPFNTLKTTYQLEYGSDTLEIHADAIYPGCNVLVVDDVLATGGTASGAVKLISQLKGNIVGCAFLMELGFLQGRSKLAEQDIFSLITY